MKALRISQLLGAFPYFLRSEKITNLFDYFVGQVMKETRGKANPVLTKEILNKKVLF